MQSPLVTVAISLVSQQVVTWAYKHPEIPWINKKNVQLVSVLASSALAVGTAYASGELNEGVVGNALEASYDALVASGLAVAFYEWGKKAFVSFCEWLKSKRGQA